MSDEVKCPDHLVGIRKGKRDGEIIMDRVYTNEEFVQSFAQKMRNHSDNGFSPDRNFRMIGNIPESVVVKEKLNTPEEMEEFLKSSHGEKYRTVKKGI